VLLLLAASATPVAAQDDIKAFGVTDISGEFSVRYRLDDWSNNNSSNQISFVNNPT
jgi:hypothetical protein